MAIFSVLLLIQTYLQLRGLETTIQGLAAPAQIFCKSLLELPSEHLSFYQGVACGTSVKKSTYDILKTVSLWHLIIVSGGHFKLIQWILNRGFPQFPKFHQVVLIAFCLWTGAQPPVVRAYFDLSIHTASNRLKLFIPPGYALLYAASTCLLFFPSWGSSWSFLLSWLCALLILHLEGRSFLIQAIGLSLGLYPVLSVFSAPHPLSFLFNLILGPPLSLILFPACLLMIPIPKLHLIIDPILNFMLSALTSIIGSANERRPHYPVVAQIKFCWIYVLSLQAFLLYRQRKNHESRHQKNHH
jgi:predicted membrane metal-binding protein